MTYARARHLMWAATIGLFMIGGWKLRSRPLPSVAAPHYPALPALNLTRPTGDLLTLSVGTITEKDVFRLGTADEQPAAAQPVHGAPPAPTLTLRGLIGGPPWEVLVEGVPGREGVVVLRVGQEVSGVMVTSVRGDTVALRGLDTTWTLTFHPMTQ